MNTEFAFFSLPRPQLIELHRAMLTRYIIEEQLREGQGLEPVEPPKILDTLERLLNLNADEAHVLFHRMEDELWEYSWFRYTDEWAWFRASQDVKRELGARGRRLKPDALEQRIEERYAKDFERYAAEVDMHDQNASGQRTRQTKRHPKP